MIEIWEHIPGFWPYQASSFGNIMRKGKVLKARENGDGYLKIGVCINGKPIDRKIHRLVALAFIPNPQNKEFINHKNGNKTDNRIENLEWVTKSENEYHKAHTLGKCSVGSKKLGNHPRAKTVLQKSLSGELIKIWSCPQEAHQVEGHSFQAISRCIQGKLKQHHGFIWERPALKQEMFSNKYD